MKTKMQNLAFPSGGSSVSLIIREDAMNLLASDASCVMEAKVVEFISLHLGARVKVWGWIDGSLGIWEDTKKAKYTIPAVYGYIFSISHLTEMEQEGEKVSVLYSDPTTDTSVVFSSGTMATVSTLSLSEIQEQVQEQEQEKEKKNNLGSYKEILQWVATGIFGLVVYTTAFLWWQSIQPTTGSEIMVATHSIMEIEATIGAELVLQQKLELAKKASISRVEQLRVAKGELGEKRKNLLLKK